MPEAFPRIRATRRTGTEAFHQAGRPLGIHLLDFWQWASSDLVSNALRGVLAEYLVACALGVAEGARSEWDACDLVTPDGVLVEVKSSAYLQSWHQGSLSRPSFSMPETHAWDPETNRFAKEKRRQAQVYVFALQTHQVQATLDPLDVAQWEFYVLPAKVLDTRSIGRKSFGLAALEKLEPKKVKYAGLRAAIEAAAQA
jgi:hypothetical protein